tara:strand:- start:49231 stop:49713 length:483 start_codon:yes stop_codon:yes gene_type:complete
MWALIGCGALCATAVVQLKRFQENHALFVNVSESLPNWAFFIQGGKQARKGDYVFFAPPRSKIFDVHFAGDKSPFGKKVLGVPGDIVTRSDNVVLINGRTVARLKPVTSKGLELTPGPVGIIPDRCIYAGTGHKDGFDSRYAEIGFVCRNQIMGKGTPIL